MIHSLLPVALSFVAHSAANAPAPLEALESPTLSAEVAQAAAEEKKEPKWTGAVLVGTTMTTGNSETRQANATADATLEREKDRITLGFLWVYGQNNNPPNADWVVTDRKTYGRGKYDYFLSKQTYVYGLGTAEGDLQQNIDLRWTAGAGVGHQFLDNDTWKFGLEAGVSFIDTDYGQDPSTGMDIPGTEDTAARIATNTTYAMNKTWGFAHTLEAYPSLEDSDDIYGRSDLRATATLTESMLLSLQWVVDYDNTPAAGFERVDNRYLVSLGWKF